MLNYIWLGLIALAVLMGGYNTVFGTPGDPVYGGIREVGDASVSSAKAAVELAFGLIGVMTMWLGLMRLADRAGLVRRLGLVLKPILVWLFPEVPAGHPAMGAIVLNVAANILGLNNAATPLGLRAMSELNKLNPRPGVATNAMCMLLAINTSSITLIPVTAIGLLAFYHGKNPTIIIGTSLAATACAQLCAIATCKLLERTGWSQRQWETAPLTAADPTAPGESAASAQGAEVEKKAQAADADLPWAPGAPAILLGFSLVFLAMVALIAFPNLIGRPLSPDDAQHIWPVRLINALSILVLPWLILLFPLYAALRKIPVYDEFVEGGKEGFNVILRILPYIVAMLVAVGMFRAAGGMHMITWALSPLTDLIHFPSELVPMALIRPFSSTAALALLTDLVKNPAYGPDNLITLMAATFYGCSETTFYVIAVYFGSVGVKKTRHAIPTGIVADTVGPIAAVLICRAVLG
jgi:spore maturation protein SpmA/spore maturation protein SpmB